MAHPPPPPPLQTYSPMHSPKDNAEVDDADTERYRYLADLLHHELHRTDANNSNNNIPRKFSYLRCLELADQQAFQAKMVELLVKNCKNRATQETIIQQGGLRMSTWQAIMNQIPLSVKYCVWRRAHWGENGRRKVDESNAQVFTRYHGLLAEIKGTPLQNNQDADDDAREVVNLLYSEQSMSHLSHRFVFPSLWSDKAASKRIWKNDMCF